MWKFTKLLIRSLPFRLVETNFFVSIGLRGRLCLSGSAGSGIVSSCISSLMICGSSRVSVRLDGPREGDLVGVGRGGSPRSTSTLISRSTSSSSMIITGSLGVALGGGGTGEGCFRGARRRIQHRSPTRESQHPTRTHVVSRRRLATDTPPTPKDQRFVNATAVVRCPELYPYPSEKTIPRILQ
jgi:hypothetical protein